MVQGMESARRMGARTMKRRMGMREIPPTMTYGLPISHHAIDVPSHPGF
jgi:hypothetical protein